MLQLQNPAAHLQDTPAPSVHRSVIVVAMMLPTTTGGAPRPGSVHDKTRGLPLGGSLDSTSCTVDRHLLRFERHIHPPHTKEDAVDLEVDEERLIMANAGAEGVPDDAVPLSAVLDV